MTKSFDVTELVRIFRSGLLALLPVMDAARIRWADPGVYDPWENIERTLFSSVVGSCVENRVDTALRPLAAYGLTYADYEAHSFISERGLRTEGKPNALMALQIGNEPFDTALLRELDASLIATGRTISRPIGLCAFDLAGRTPVGIDYHESITYLD
jgi:hypothetical protein